MMKTHQRPGPTILVIFGASGDLTWRKLTPALFNLKLDGWIPERFTMLGLGRDTMTDNAFRKRLRDGVEKHSRRDSIDDEQWKKFAGGATYMQIDVTTPAGFDKLRKRIEDVEKDWDTPTERIFYLAVPPRVVGDLVEQLGEAKLNRPRERARVVVEKPFGRDLQSARDLNRRITKIFDEPQIFRIDHFLGKETVQNILAFRFANALFEPLWNRHYIDHIQITVSETVGVGHRAGYYEQSGALRDMVQNHLIQLFCLVAMEPPVAFKDQEVRNRKVDVLHAVRPIVPERVNEVAVRGQYGSGRLDGDNLLAYREEEGVDPESETETYAAIKLEIDNWRWQGVPFYLRTGKRMRAKASELVVQFRPVPHQVFLQTMLMESHPNRLVFSIQPHEGIFLRFDVKHPGLSMQLSPVRMQFDYSEAFSTSVPEAYETLLRDIMLNDSMLFMRADQAEAAWSILDPILHAWDEIQPYSFPNYETGSWGPHDAEVLIAGDGRSWLIPTSAQHPIQMPKCNVSTEDES